MLAAVHPRPRIALVHDWLTGMRGGERCLEILCELLPDSPLFTLLHVPGSVSSVIENREIRTSFIQALPLARHLYRYWLPLFPTAIERFDFRDFDVIVSSSHCVAKGAIPRPDAVHICYCHTPMRYVWGSYEEYFGKIRARGLGRYIVPLVANYLRTWDVASSTRVDRFVAASRAVRDRIWRYYRREAAVVYPPVRTEGTYLSEGDDGYYLVVSAFVPYKRIDVAIKAFRALGDRLVVVGAGPEGPRLKALAGTNIEFVGHASDVELSRYYARCKALVFPGEEDFGIVPVEAQCYGKPVIAYGSGGTLETVRGVWPDRSSRLSTRGATGVFFAQQDPAALCGAVRMASRVDFDAAAIRRHALRFGGHRHRAAMERIITESASGSSRRERQAR
jgi:glycosyltransferase involved in cell wall biosynthesis